MQAILTSLVAEEESDYESERYHDQLDLDLLLDIERKNKWLDSSQQMYSVVISEKPPYTDFKVKFKGTKQTVHLTQVPRCPVFLTAAIGSSV